MDSGEDPMAPERHLDSIGTVSLYERVEAKLRKLTLEERKVMRLRHGLEDARTRTFAEIAQEIGKSPSTARRRYISGIVRLREDNKANPLHLD